MNTSSPVVWSLLLTLTLYLTGAQVNAATPAAPHAAAVAAPAAIPADCLPRYASPTTQFGKMSKNQSDVGIIALGFVDLTVFGKPVQTLAGVDLNSGTIDDVTTRVDMAKLKYCGANFVFIRLSGRDNYVTAPPGFKGEKPAWRLWNDALKAGLGVYPFHYLYPSDDVLKGRVAGGYPYSEEKKPELFARMTQDGHDQAAEFIQAYQDSHLHPQQPSEANLPQYISLDIEAVLPPQFSTQSNYQVQNRITYALGYARMACAWIEDVQKKFPQAKILLYTDMQMDGEYQVMNANYTDNQCLAGYDVWLALPTAHGGHFADDEENLDTRTKARKFCYSANANHDRCTIHQYTQRANFAMTATNPKTILDMDLDRFNVGSIPWNLAPLDPQKAKTAVKPVVHGAGAKE